MRVAVVAEYYPRAADPVLGVWAHRQALAARDAGADVRVLVLHRPVPSRAALAARDGRCSSPLRQPLRTRARRHRGHLRAVPRAAAAAHLRAVGRVGGADARARAAADASVRPRPRPLRGARRRRGAAGEAGRAGGDLRPRRRRAVRRAPAEGRARSSSGRCAHATLVLANSAGTETRARELGAVNTRVVHLGTDVPPQPAARARPPDRPHRRPPRRPQAPRRRPARAVAAARRPPRPALGRGRRRPGAARRSSAWRPSSSSTRRVELQGRAAARRGPAAGHGVRAPERRRGVRRRLRRGDGGRRARDRLPRRGRPGGDPRQRRRDPARRARRPGAPGRRAARACSRTPPGGASSAPAARATVEREFTWEACGRATVAAYREALR